MAYVTGKFISILKLTLYISLSYRVCAVCVWFVVVIVHYWPCWEYTHTVCVFQLPQGNLPVPTPSTWVVHMYSRATSLGRRDHLAAAKGFAFTFCPPAGY